jgi:hypothetical protein
MTRVMRDRRAWMLLQAMWLSVIAIGLTHAVTRKTVGQTYRVKQQLDREQTALLLDSLEVLARAERDAGRDPGALAIAVPDWGRLTVKPAAKGWTLVATPAAGTPLERPLSR